MPGIARLLPGAGGDDFSRGSEACARHVHATFHQDAGAAAHDGLGDLPFAVHQLRLRADAQRARGVAEADLVALAPPAAWLTSVPGTAAAVAMATEAVPIMAWCSLPMDSARTSTSTSPAPIFLPLEAT